MYFLPLVFKAIWHGGANTSLASCVVYRILNRESPLLNMLPPDSTQAYAGCSTEPHLEITKPPTHDVGPGIIRNHVLGLLLTFLTQCTHHRYLQTKTMIRSMVNRYTQRRLGLENTAQECRLCLVSVRAFALGSDMRLAIALLVYVGRKRMFSRATT